MDIQSAQTLARSELGKSLLDLEPSAIIELYELYFDVQSEPFRFHGGTNNLSKEIIWNGNPYYPTGIEVEGFESNIMGRLPRPKITVSNGDYVISSILRDYSDFKNGKFVRIKVFLKHLDNENFDDNTNPFGNPNSFMYISKEKYIVSQKIMENKQIVQFELITPFDLESLQTATRAIYGRYCYWQYRGMGCGYTGDLIGKENGADFKWAPKIHIRNSEGKFVLGTMQATIATYLWRENINYSIGDVVCVKNIDLNGFKDPKVTWFVCQKSHVSSKFTNPNASAAFWDKDGCSKSIESCRKRFGEAQHSTMSINYDIQEAPPYVANTDFYSVVGVLPFGGFPGTDTFKYE
jgi:lambda family phage minor tail protein L